MEFTYLTKENKMSKLIKNEIELKFAKKELMLKCLNDLYEMHVELSLEDDLEDIFGKGERKFCIKVYKATHYMIGYLEEFNLLDLDTSFKCNIANISIDHYLDDEHSPTRCRVVKRMQNEIQSIWGV